MTPDSRAEKEIDALIRSGCKVWAIGWDRERRHPFRKETLEVYGAKADIYRVGIKGEFSGGVRKNIAGLIKFQIKMFVQLVKMRKNIDIVHACDFDTALTAEIFTKLFRKKLVYDIFDYYVHCAKIPKLLKGIVEKLDRMVINKADAVLICTEQRREQIAGTKPKLLAVIHNTPGQLIQTAQKRGKSDKIKIVYAGVLLENRFLKEMTEVVSESENYELHIGGFGQLEDYMRKAAETYSNIYFHGSLLYEDVLQLENGCDILTAVYNPQIPNHRYAAPNKFYEALMLGKPVIMAKGTGMADIIENNHFGAVCAYSKDSFGKALKEVSAELNNFEEKSKKMKELYRTEYSWDIMEKRLLDVYRQIWS